MALGLGTGECWVKSFWGTGLGAEDLTLNPKP